MVRHITIDTSAYTRSHGHTPWPHDKGMWAITLDDQSAVIVRYGLYKDLLTWAKAQATRTVHVLP